jgi:hypothetical protein
MSVHSLVLFACGDHVVSGTGSVIQARGNDAPEQGQLWNPVSGAVIEARVAASSYPSRQRVAP